eukprot:Opistho-2@59929
MAATAQGLLAGVIILCAALHWAVHAAPAGGGTPFQWPKASMQQRTDADAAALKFLNGHQCTHDDLPMLTTATVQDYANNDRRRDASSSESTWAPFRITYSAVPGSIANLTASQADYLMGTVVPRAIERFAQTLLVIPVASNITLSRWCAMTYSGLPDSVPQEYRCYQYEPPTCGPTQVPSDHLGQQYECDYTVPNLDLSTPSKYCRPLAGGRGIPNSDLHIYISADPSWCGQYTVAAANTCVRDQMDRSIAGFINMCPYSYLALDPARSPIVLDGIVSVLRHEITHILALSSGHFPFFRDESGAPRTPRSADGMPPYDPTIGYYTSSTSTVAKFAENGKTVTKIVTPTVLSEVRSHFGCDGLNGAELEDGGGAGTAGSHWEQRVFYSEYMQGTTSGHEMSAITYAVLRDSGWYRTANSCVADPLTYGFKRGCEFVTGRCGGSADPQTFCSWKTETDCTPQLMLQGKCHDGCSADGMYHSLCADAGLTDTCSIYIGYSNGNCLDASNTASLGFFAGTYRGAKLGLTSKCMFSTLLSTLYNPITTLYPACYSTECTFNGTSPTLAVIIDGNRYICTQEGQTISVPGYSGVVYCPRVTTYCPQTNCDSTISATLPNTWNATSLAQMSASSAAWAAASAATSATSVAQRSASSVASVAASSATSVARAAASAATSATSVAQRSASSVASVAASSATSVARAAASAATSATSVAQRSASSVASVAASSATSVARAAASAATSATSVAQRSASSVASVAASSATSVARAAASAATSATSVAQRSA